MGMLASGFRIIKGSRWVFGLYKGLWLMRVLDGYSGFRL